LKKTLSFTLILSLSLGLLLSGCGSAGSENPGAGTEKRVVNICSWGEYIDPNLIDQFQNETGIKVNYQTAESNEALYSLLKTGGANYDVIVPSDYMISLLIEEDMLAQLNFDNIPNFSLIGDAYKNLSYDPENLYSVPYAWGTLGIIYNPTMTGGDIDGWDALFDPQYAGNVLMIRNPRDAIGIALMSLGYSVNTINTDEINEAYARLADAKQAGVYQSFVMDEVFDKMETGEAAIAPYYAGDYVSMLEVNEDLRFVLPQGVGGSNWFVDAMCVLKDAENKDEAEAWINFMCSTEASLANMDYIYYASPNQGALEQYPAYYEEVYGAALDPGVFEIMAPSQSVLKHCEAYLTLPQDILTLYSNLWIQMGI